jgi:hypothetical protein
MDCLLLSVFRLFNNSAGQARSRCTGRISLQIVYLGMDHDRFADDGLIAAQLQQAVNPVITGSAVGAGLDVAEIAYMALPGGSVWTAMATAIGVEMAAGGTGIGGAAITEFMDVKAMQRLRQALQVGFDPHPSIHFGKGDLTRNLTLLLLRRLQARGGLQRGCGDGRLRACDLLQGRRLLLAAACRQQHTRQQQ